MTFELEKMIYNHTSMPVHHQFLLNADVCETSVIDKNQTFPIAA